MRRVPEGRHNTRLYLSNHTPRAGIALYPPRAANRWGSTNTAMAPPFLRFLRTLGTFLQTPGSHMSSNRDISATYYRSGRSYA
jgi:hypothetical protein